MNTNQFDVAVPDSELEGPAFTVMPTGTYRSTLVTGAVIVDNAATGGSWKALQLPFLGFKDAKSGKEFQRSLNARFTFESANDQAVKIGMGQIIAAAAAVGLTEPTVTNDGKPAQKLAIDTAGKSNEEVVTELIDAFNQVAGTEVEVYLTGGPRIRKGKAVLKADGVTPFMDNEIKRVSAAK